MRKTTILAAALASIGAGLFSSAAYAEQPKNNKGENYGYTFSDDALLGNDLGGQSGIIKVRPVGVRDRLIRPRTQFIAEMLKSVENL